MEQQFKEYVTALNLLKESRAQTDKRFYSGALCSEKYQSFYAISENNDLQLNLSREALFIDADVDAYVRWLLLNGEN